MIVQGGIDTTGMAHKTNNGAKVWAITTGGANYTVVLPPIADNFGNYIDIVKDDNGAGYIIVDGNASETINGVATITIEKQYCGLRLYGAASEWIVVGTIGECEIQTIGNAIELVYRKSWTGTLNASGDATIAHGITDEYKITKCEGRVWINALTYSYASDNGLGLAHASYCYAQLDPTNLIIEGGANYGTSSIYHMELKYYI